MLNSKKKKSKKKAFCHFISPGKYSANLEGSNISFRISEIYFGVSIDQTPFVQDQISSVCRVSFLELRRLASIRHYLSKEPLQD